MIKSGYSKIYAATNIQSIDYCWYEVLIKKMYQGDTINVWENKTKSCSSIHKCKHVI